MEIKIPPLLAISEALKTALLEELKKESNEADVDIAAASAMGRVKARVEAGEIIIDPFNAGDALALALAKV